MIGVVSWSTAPGDEEGCGGLTGVTPLLLYRDWIVDTARKIKFSDRAVTQAPKRKDPGPWVRGLHNATWPYERTYQQRRIVLNRPLKSSWTMRQCRGPAYA